MDKLGVGVVTTTITTTSGAGISSGSAVDYDTVHEETTTVYSTTTLTTTSTTAVDTTSSGVLTYSTVVTTSTTETIAVDMTSSSGVYYTKVVSGTSPDGSGGEESEWYSSMQSSSAVYVTNKASTSCGVDRIITPSITVTDGAFLNAAIANYTTIGVGSAEVLAELATMVNSGVNMAGKTFVLTEDIDLSGYSSWTPIGNVTSFYNSSIVGYAFAGTLDGQGHVITGLTDSLFGYTDEANIRNLGIENYNEVVNTSTDDYNLKEFHGSLIAVAQNTDISNCYATGSISYSVSVDSSITTSNTDNIYIGGLIGSAIDNVNINNSHFSGDISVEHVALTWEEGYIVTSYVYTGGLIGRIQQYSSISQATTINNSYVTGSISASARATYKPETTEDYDYARTYSYAGGLVGNISVSDYSTNISNSYFNGSVSASARSDVNFTGNYWQEPGVNEAYSGGLVGYIEQTWFSTDTVFATTTISKSYAIGSVDTVLGSGISGGLVGYLGDRGVFNIKDSYTSVSVSASSGYAGGIYGGADSDSGYYNTYTLNVQSSFALGESSGNKSGGIFGFNDSSHTNFSGVYYNSSKNTNSAVTGITGVEESMFTANNIQIMGFTESKGWMYIDSSVLPQLKSQNEISNETLLKELLGDACADQTVVIETTSGTENIVISADDSIVEKLQEAGMIVGIEDGKVYISGGTNKILSVSEELFDALNLVATPAQSSGSGSNSGGNSGGNTTQISTIYISSSASNVALSSVGVNSTNYITVKNGSTTSIVTVDASTTVSQLAAALAGVGITTDVTNGKFTFSGDDTHYILGITTNLKSALNLMDTGGQGYQAVKATPSGQSKQAPPEQSRLPLLIPIFSLAHSALPARTS